MNNINKLANSEDVFTLQIPNKDCQKIENNSRKILDYANEPEEKLVQIVTVLIQGQNETQNLIKRKFKDIGVQHEKLFYQNHQLNRKLDSVQNESRLISNQLQEKFEKKKPIVHRIQN